MSIYTKRSGVTNHPETSVLQEFTDVVKKSGVVNPSTDFVVSQDTPPSMTISVASGRAYIKGSGNCYPVNSDAAEELTIDNNTSGSSRIDSVVLYIDIAATPNSTGQGADVAKLDIINGTPAASPSAPDDSAIQSAIGASNPFLRLANITVINGETAIETADISNVGQRVFMKSYRPIKSVAYASTVTLDANDGDASIVLTGDITLNAPTNMEIGDWLVIKLDNGSASSRSVTWWSGITDKSADVSMASGTNKVTIYSVQKTGSAAYDRYLVGKDYT